MIMKNIRKRMKQLLETNTMVTKTKILVDR